MSCEHTFEENKRTFTHPIILSYDVKGLTQETLRDLIFGFTNIKLQCLDCGDIKIIKANGKV